MDHVVGRRQVDADAARLQADEEQVALAGLEGVHAALAFLDRGRSVQVLVGDALGVEILADQGQVVDELAEHQHLVPVLEQVGRQAREGRQLAAGDAGAGRHQLGIAAGAAQPHHLGQDLDRLLSLGRLERGQLVEGLAPQRFVQRVFLGAQFHRDHDLGARRQLGQHLRLGAAQDEGRGQASQARARACFGAFVLGFLDRAGETQLELVGAAQQARIDEAEQVPQFSQVVFQRRAGGRHAEVPLQRHHRLRALGVHVLDRLGLVEHDAVPAPALEARRFQLQQAVADHDHVERPRVVDRGGAFAGTEQLQVQGRREARRLVDPVQAHRGRRHHQRRAVLGAREQQRQRLQRLAQAHVVGQAGAHAPVGQARQPLEAFDLIIAQLGLQGGRQLGHEGGIVGHAFQVSLPGLVGVDVAGVPRQLVQREAGQRMGADAVAVQFAIRAQLRQAPVQLVGQGQVFVLAQGHEAAAALLDLFQQGAQVHHAPFVDDDVAAGREPVALAPDLHPHRLRRGLLRDPEFFALGPGDQDGVAIDRAQLVDQFQCQQRLAEQPFAVVWLRVFEGLALADQLALGFALGVQVAPRFGADALDVGDHIGRALAGAVIGAVRQGAHQQLHAHPLLVGTQQHVQARVGRHGLDIAVAGADVRLHGDDRRHRADRAQHAALGRHRHRQACADDGGDAPVLVPDVHQAQAGRRLARDHDFAVAVLHRRMQHDRHRLAVLLDQQFRLARQQLDPGAGRIHPEQQRMADQGGQRLVHLELETDAAAGVVAAAGDRVHRLQVLRGEEVEPGAFLGQAFQAHGAAAAPAALRIAFLLARLQLLHAQVGVVADQPDQARLADVFHVRRRLQVDQGVQLAFPRFFAREPAAHVGQAVLASQFARTLFMRQVAGLAHLRQHAGQLGRPQVEAGRLGLGQHVFQPCTLRVQCGQGQPVMDQGAEHGRFQRHLPAARAEQRGVDGAALDLVQHAELEPDRVVGPLYRARLDLQPGVRQLAVSRIAAAQQGGHRDVCAMAVEYGLALAGFTAQLLDRRIDAGQACIRVVAQHLHHAAQEQAGRIACFAHQRQGVVQAPAQDVVLAQRAAQRAFRAAARHQSLGVLAYRWRKLGFAARMHDQDVQDAFAQARVDALHHAWRERARADVDQRMQVARLVAALAGVQQGGNDVVFLSGQQGDAQQGQALAVAAQHQVALPVAAHGRDLAIGGGHAVEQAIVEGRVQHRPGQLGRDGGAALAHLDHQSPLAQARQFIDPLRDRQRHAQRPHMLQDALAAHRFARDRQHDQQRPFFRRAGGQARVHIVSRHARLSISTAGRPSGTGMPNTRR